MVRHILLTASILGLVSSGASAQFYSIDAGTDGVNLHVSNFIPAIPAPVVVAPAPVVVPLRPGFVMPPSPHRYHKAIKKARKAYYKELRHGSYYAPYYATPAMVYVDDDYYDDYEDYIEDIHKARKKAYKKAYKHYKKDMKKHHKRHHHDD